MKKAEIKKEYIKKILENGYTSERFFTEQQIYEYYLLGLNEDMKEEKFIALTVSHKACKAFYALDNWKVRLQEQVLADDVYTYLEFYL